MPKGMPKRDDMQPLEGGVGGAGGSRSSASRMIENAAGPGLLVGAGAAGYADYKYSKARQQEKKEADEAAAELKRESRGVQKTETDRAREEADEMKLQKATDKAYNESLKNMAKGGSASARADGIAQRGKTRGTLIACGGGYMKGGK